MDQESPVTAQIVVSIHQNGAMSIKGPVADKEWCLAVLRNAVDAVKGSNLPSRNLVVPDRDVEVPGR